MIHIEVKVSSNDGQAMVGGMFFSLSKADENIIKKHYNVSIMENIKTVHRTITEEIAEYIYQVFQAFNNKYEATPIKVQKLIFISEMVSRYNYNQTILPENTIFECNGCGFRIPTFDGKIKDFISIGDLADKKIDLTDTESNEIDYLIDVFSKRNIISERSLRIISDTIIQFGRYYPHSIGEILNDFKKNSGDELFLKKPPFFFFSDDFNTLLTNLEKINDRNVIADFIISYEQ